MRPVFPKLNHLTACFLLHSICKTILENVFRELLLSGSLLKKFHTKTHFFVVPLVSSLKSALAPQHDHTSRILMCFSNIRYSVDID